ncbi:hypothetical protein PR048_020078 [Dryococelus australis]|uniref:Uncharacterized protein n=1 Tax=Dryococelus australis TaxID=614101 RepID=A0ABQ9H5B0_9NEOP|nr:hypothetical protein PR048_020078 [Dryococelus australis]
MEVICSNHEGEFDNMVIRLGGFHTLVMFLGTIGDLISGSGIEEVYAKNTVPRMLRGKAYSRALRGHFLISSALTAIIIADILKRKEHLLKSQSRTSKLWIFYLNMVSRAKTFIWAE